MTDAPRILRDPIRVRIALRVNAQGQWLAIGSDQLPEPERLSSTQERFEDAEETKPYWVEVDVPLPRIHALKATLTAAEDA